MKCRIVYDEMSCYNWGFSINGVWRSGEVEEGVKQPEEDDELLDYLLLKLKEGIKNGKFLIQKCSSCENFQFFPRSFCITCSSDSLDWIAASGNGVVYSTTTVRRKAEIGGDFNVSLIDLDEGVRVMGNVVDVDPSEVFIGLKVRLEIIQENGQGKVQFKSGTTK